jgi:hypothetical protein
LVLVPRTKIRRKLANFPADFPTDFSKNEELEKAELEALRKLITKNLLRIAFLFTTSNPKAPPSLYVHFLIF